MVPPISSKKNGTISNFHTNQFSSKMEDNFYKELMSYIRNNEFIRIESLSEKEITKIKRKRYRESFQIENNKLYKLVKTGKKVMNMKVKVERKLYVFSSLLIKKMII